MNTAKRGVDMFSETAGKDHLNFDPAEFSDGATVAGIYGQMVEAHLLQFKLQQKQQRRLEFVIMLQVLALVFLYFR